MTIAVKCTKCDWKGRAEVGRRAGLRLSDQECPQCGSDIKRAPGSYAWGDIWAELKQYIRQRNGH